MEKTTPKSLALRKLVVSAIFLALSIAVKFIFPGFYLPLAGGANGMKVGLSGIFSIVPAILCGPFYGGAVSGLSDVIGHFMNPAGAYLPQMTLVLFLGGVIRGAVFLFLKEKRERSIRISVIILTVLFAVFGIWSILSLRGDGISRHYYDMFAGENSSSAQGTGEDRLSIDDIPLDNMSPVGRILITRSIDAKDPGSTLSGMIQLVTLAPLFAAGFSLFLILVDFAVKKLIKTPQKQSYVLKILISMLISGVFVTTCNTWILRVSVYSSWKAIPFFILWLPRLFEELLSNSVKVYFVALFYGVFLKEPRLSRILEKSEEAESKP